MIQNEPIDVISLCNADGVMWPLRFRIKGDTGIRVDIDRVISTKPVRMVGIEGIIFLCRCSMEGVTRVVELKYTIRSHIWNLLRVVE